MAEGIAPWLQAAQPAEYFGRAYAAGAQIAHARAQLQAQQQRADLEAELQQQRLQQQSLMEQHRMEIERQYRQSQFGLEQQRLAETQKMNEMQLKRAAAQMQEQEAYRRETAGISDPAQIMQAALRHAGMLPSAAGLGSMATAAARLNQAQLPMEWTGPNPTTGAPGYFSQGTGGRPYFPPRGPTDKASLYQQAQKSGLLHQMNKLNDLLLMPDMKEDDRKKYEAQLQQVQQQLRALGSTDEQGTGQSLPFIGMDQSGNYFMTGQGAPTPVMPSQGGIQALGSMPLPGALEGEVTLPTAFQNQYD